MLTRSKAASVILHREKLISFIFGAAFRIRVTSESTSCMQPAILVSTTLRMRNASGDALQHHVMLRDTQPRKTRDTHNTQNTTHSITMRNNT